MFYPAQFIAEYEEGNLSGEEIVEGFQQLIDSGLCWKLQGHYGRKAKALIKSGHCLIACEGS